MLLNQRAASEAKPAQTRVIARSHTDTLDWISAAAARRAKQQSRADAAPWWCL
jgi:hypothetical protein